MNPLLPLDIDRARADLRGIDRKFSVAAELIWPYFDTAYYRARYPDIAATQIDPLLHYCRFGWREGRDPSARFSTSRYLADHPDIAALGINPLLHWAVCGNHDPA